LKHAPEAISGGLKFKHFLWGIPDRRDVGTDAKL